MRLIWLVLAFIFLACSNRPVPPHAAVLIAAGDIASCDSMNDELTASILDGILLRHPDAHVALLGDLAYNTGSTTEFADCYAPSWGRFNARVRPAVGNHEYGTLNAVPYFTYFGSNAGDPTKGYYSYELGAWHIVVLNTNCDFIGGCMAGSAQEQWLRADLTANPSKCTLAYWHHPLYSSGVHGNNVFVHDLWQALMDGNADLVLVGHDHHYERFAPQNADGIQMPHGIREFIVGTGGKTLRPVTQTILNSEVNSSTTFGVLELTLNPDSYAWHFVTESTASFTDSGMANCH